MEPFQTNTIITIQLDAGLLKYFIEKDGELYDFGTDRDWFKSLEAYHCYHIRNSNSYRLVIGMYAKDEIQLL